MRLYYLTSQKHALGNIKNKRVKVSLFADLNDPYELFSFDPIDSDRKAVWNTFKDYLSTKAGLVSFSKKWNNPVMWSHYGDKHKGISLGFDVNNQIPKKVCYIKKKKDKNRTYT